MAAAPLDGAPSLAGRIPDFFIVGHAKSGTTAMYEMLREHPQLYLPESKEPWYFASELQERTPPRPEGTPRTLEEYRAWFADAAEGQRVGEASALYLWSHTAAAAIAAVQPQAQIIALLREPASFLRSLHLQLIETYVETEQDFGRALALEESGAAGGGSRATPTGRRRSLLRARPLRGAAAPLPRGLRARARARARLRGLPRRQRGDRQAGAAVPRRGRHGAGRAEPREPDGAAALPAPARPDALGLGRHGRGSLAVKGALKTVMPAGIGAGSCERQRAAPAPPPAAVDEALMARAARALQARGRRASSEYLGEDFVKRWGYEHVDDPEPSAATAAWAWCPTSSSSATPSAARPRCTRCCARIRRSSCRS